MSNPYITKSKNTLSSNLVEPKNQDPNEFNQNKSSPQKNTGFILGIILGIVLTVIGMKFLGKSEPKNIPMATPPVEQKKTSSQAITITEVSLTSINSTLEATGTVAAFELIPVMTQASNLQVTSILVDEGDVVEAGQVLARLDDTVLKAELAQAQALVAQAQARLAELQAGTRFEELQRAQENVSFAEAELRQSESDLDLAKKKLERNRTLAAEGAIAADLLDELLNEQKLQEYAFNKSKARLREAKQKLAQLQKGPREEVISQAKASLAEAEARVKLVMAKLKDTRVTAPVRGKIAERNARVGDVTSSFNSQNLFTIIENGRLELQIKIPETQLNQVKIGQSVKISSDLNPNLVLTGKVREIDPVIEQESRQATIYVDLPSNNNLKPGMFLTAEIIATSRNALTIPLNAVLPKANGEAIVYLIQPDNTVKSQPVTIGEVLADEKVEIKTGLSRGEIVALKGSAYLKDGDRVHY